MAFIPVRAVRGAGGIVRPSAMPNQFILFTAGQALGQAAGYMRKSTVSRLNHLVQKNSNNPAISVLEPKMASSMV